MEASRALESAAPAANARSRADKALERLYNRHARDVYQYALALLANPADAEDATQTTFLNAYRALQRGDRPRRPHNWLIAITHNVCRMRWRQAGHRPREVALDDAPEPVAAQHDDQPSIDDVLRALSRLSFNQRSALVMRELEGRSCKEIAETLGLSVSAVEALLFRARQRLRIERKALGVLGTAPLPGQLASALGIGGGGGGGAIASGLAALGSDAALKTATALFVVGAAASGAVAIARPTATNQPSTPPAAVHVKQANNATQAKRAATRQGAHRAHRARQTPRRVVQGGSGGSSSTQLPGVPAPPAVQVPQVPQVTQLPQLPQVPQLPQPQLPQLPVPPPPVDLPALQLPGLPVGIPPLPPPPPLPPL
jgi:RNA polymerase sigma-70 factor, ECF subfamily